MAPRTSLSHLAGFAAAALLLTHASPTAAAPPTWAADAPKGAAVAPAFQRPAFDFILGLETDVFGTLGSKRSLERLSPIEQAMISRSADGLFEVFHRDGSVTMDLQGRFQEFAFVRIGADGKPVFSCMDEYASVREALFEAPKSPPALEDR
jgi:hypothetical protein